MLKKLTLLFLMFLSIQSKASSNFVKDSLSVVRYNPEKYFSNTKTDYKYLVRYNIYSSTPLTKNNIKFFLNDAKVDLVQNKKQVYFQHSDYYRYQFCYLVKASDSVYAYRTKLCVEVNGKQECTDVSKIDKLSAKPMLTIMGMSQDFSTSSNTAKTFSDEYAPLKNNTADYRFVDIQSSILPDIKSKDLENILATSLAQYNKSGGLNEDILLSFISIRPYNKFAKAPSSILDYFTLNSKYKNAFSVNALSNLFAKTRGHKILITDMPRRELRTFLSNNKHTTVLSYIAPKSQHNDGTTDQAKSGENYLLNAVKEASSKNADVDNNNIITKDEFVNYLQKNLKCKKGKLAVRNYTKNFELFNL